MFMCVVNINFKTFSKFSEIWLCEFYSYQKYFLVYILEEKDSILNKSKIWNHPKKIREKW